MRWAIRSGLGVLAALVAAGAAAGAALGAPLAAWVQLTSAGADVRVVQPPGPCPLAQVDGRALALTVRAAADADFPTVCSAALPPGAKVVQVSGRTLAGPAARVRRIVVFGDSGCRIKGLDVQACNDPAAWPFAEVSRRAAARRPDLVIHVGDYYYREGGCPVGDLRCASSPTGDRWSAWVADFFDPAAPLLAGAPWLFVRGNHESCDRGGAGWFRLLDAAAAYTPCPARAEPWSADIGGLRLDVLDSAVIPDRQRAPRARARFGADLNGLRAADGATPAWVVVHRPIWGLAPVVRLGPFGPFNVAVNLNEQAAVRRADMAGVALILSGHIHDFASLSFDGGVRPAQLIVGTGGDVGLPSDTPTVSTRQVEVDGRSATRTEFDRFGYLVLDRVGDGGQVWTAVFYDAQDHPVVQCRLDGRTLACHPPH
jgi:hypothetical protein